MDVLLFDDGCKSTKKSEKQTAAKGKKRHATYFVRK